MKKYYNSLIIIMVVSEIVCLISPSAESTRKNIKPVCGLLLLLTLVSPVISFFRNTDIVDIDSVFTTEKENTDIYESQAYAVLGYIEDKYGIEYGRIVFITEPSDITDDEVGGEALEPLAEIQLFIDDCPYNIREAVRRDLISEYGTEVRIYCGGNYGDE